MDEAAGACLIKTRWRWTGSDSLQRSTEFWRVKEGKEKEREVTGGEKIQESGEVLQ